MSVSNMLQPSHGSFERSACKDHRFPSGGTFVEVLKDQSGKPPGPSRIQARQCYAPSGGARGCKVCYDGSKSICSSHCSTTAKRNRIRAFFIGDVNHVAKHLDSEKPLVVIASNAEHAAWRRELAADLVATIRTNSADYLKNHKVELSTGVVTQCTSKDWSAIGDIHGDYNAVVLALYGVGAITLAEGAEDIGSHLNLAQHGIFPSWREGFANCVFQTGDISDRGFEFKYILDLFMKLEYEAAVQGGRLVFMLGNHEMFQFFTDKQAVEQYIPQQDHDTFMQTVKVLPKFVASPSGIEAFHQHTASLRLHYWDERVKAFDPQNGEYGKWLLAHPVVAVDTISSTVFCHAGINTLFLHQFLLAVASPAFKTFRDEFHIKFPEFDFPQGRWQNAITSLMEEAHNGTSNKDWWVKAGQYVKNAARQVKKFDGTKILLAAWDANMKLSNLVRSEVLSRTRDEERLELSTEHVVMLLNAVARWQLTEYIGEFQTKGSTQTDTRKETKGRLLSDAKEQPTKGVLPLWCEDKDECEHDLPKDHRMSDFSTLFVCKDLSKTLLCERAREPDVVFTGTNKFLGQDGGVKGCPYKQGETCIVGDLKKSVAMIWSPLSGTGQAPECSTADEAEKAEFRPEGLTEAEKAERRKNKCVLPAGVQWTRVFQSDGEEEISRASVSAHLTQKTLAIKDEGKDFRFVSGHSIVKLAGGGVLAIGKQQVGISGFRDIKFPGYQDFGIASLPIVEQDSGKEVSIWLIDVGMSYYYSDFRDAKGHRLNPKDIRDHLNEMSSADHHAQLMGQVDALVVKGDTWTTLKTSTFLEEPGKVASTFEALQRSVENNAVMKLMEPVIEPVMEHLMEPAVIGSGADIGPDHVMKDLLHIVPALDAAPDVDVELVKPEAVIEL